MTTTVFEAIKANNKPLAYKWAVILDFTNFYSIFFKHYNNFIDVSVFIYSNIL